MTRPSTLLNLHGHGCWLTTSTRSPPREAAPSLALHVYAGSYSTTGAGTDHDEEPGDHDYSEWRWDRAWNLIRRMIRSGDVELANRWASPWSGGSLRHSGAVRGLKVDESARRVRPALDRLHTWRLCAHCGAAFQRPHRASGESRSVRLPFHPHAMSGPTGRTHSWGPSPVRAKRSRLR